MNAIIERETECLPSEQVEIKKMLVMMADVIRATHEEMAELKAEVRRLTKVTPAQVKELQRTVRERAAALCATHRAEGCETAIANAIRKSVKLTCGIGSMRELPRGDYEVAMQQITWWDDYKMIKTIKAKKARETK